MNLILRKENIYKKNITWIAHTYKETHIAPLDQDIIAKKKKNDYFLDGNSDVITNIAHDREREEVWVGVSLICC